MCPCIHTCVRTHTHTRTRTRTRTRTHTHTSVSLSVTVDSISYSSGEQVTGGSVSVKAKYGIIPIYSHTFDLCTLLDEVHQQCPDSAGVHNATVTETIPSEVPGVCSCMPHFQ